MRELTVKQYAEREQVDERTVRRWIEKGAIDARKTPGGRFRIEVNIPSPAKPPREINKP